MKFGTYIQYLFFISLLGYF